MLPIIRAETDLDHQAIWHINQAAFGANAEANLVNALREGDFAEVSLVAESDGKLVGHILFSRVTIRTNSGTIAALSLAPMAVLPHYQRQGIGTALVEEGLAACLNRGQKIVLVLGHPAFYPKFGFSSDLAISLASPFGGGEAWMALELVPNALAGISGQVEFSPPFLELE